MEVYWRTYLATEELNNNTICVLDGNGIRKMRYREDINEHLIFVSNEDTEPYLHKPIPENTICRCVEINVSTKTYI